MVLLVSDEVRRKTAAPAWSLPDSPAAWWNVVGMTVTA